MELTTVRRGPSLASREVEDLRPGTEVTVLDERLVDGHVRAQLTSEHQEDRDLDNVVMVVTDDDTISLGDQVMIISQACQLVTYGVAAVCLQNKEERIESDLAGTSDEVALFAAVVGFFVVAVQAIAVAHMYAVERRAEQAQREEAAPTMQFECPLAQGAQQGGDEEE